MANPYHDILTSVIDHSINGGRNATGQMDDSAQGAVKALTGHAKDIENAGNAGGGAPGESQPGEPEGGNAPPGAPPAASGSGTSPLMQAYLRKVLEAAGEGTDEEDKGAPENGDTNEEKESPEEEGTDETDNDDEDIVENVRIYRTASGKLLLIDNCGGKGGTKGPCKGSGKGATATVKQPPAAKSTTKVPPQLKTPKSTKSSATTPSVTPTKGKESKTASENPSKATGDNCGIGKGGFQKGNACAKGGKSGSNKEPTDTHIDDANKVAKGKLPPKKAIKPSVVSTTPAKAPVVPSSTKKPIGKVDKAPQKTDSKDTSVAKPSSTGKLTGKDLERGKVKKLNTALSLQESGKESVKADLQQGSSSFHKVELGDKTYLVKELKKVDANGSNSKQIQQQEVVMSKLADLAGVKAPTVDGITFKGKTSVAYGWLDGKAIADHDNPNEALKKVPKDEIGQHVAFSFLADTVDRHRGNYFVSADNHLYTIDHEGAMTSHRSNRHSMEEKGRLNIEDNELLRLANGGKKNYDLPLSKKGLEKMIASVPKMKEELEKQGMDDEAYHLGKRARILTEAIKEKNPTVRSLLRALGYKKGMHE